MTIRRPTVLLVLAMASTVLVHAGSAPAPQFRSRVETVRVDVLVSDRGRPVRGLTKEDFEIRDNGVPQQIDRVSFEEIPLNLVLVLDTSGSLGDRRLAVLGEAAGALLEDLGKDARAALVTFNHVVAQRIGLTSDLPAVRRAISRLTGGGSTALNDGVYAGMMLAQADADRAIVVVLSDGVDTMSWLTPDAVLDTARRSDVVLYSVYTGGPRAPALLRDLASVTGGAIFQNVAADRLQKTFAGIAEEFRQRYLVTYSPAGVKPGGWHALDVRVKGRRLTVRARPGYMGDG